MGSRFAGKVLSKEGKLCVYFVVIYWSILSINRHGNSLLELCFLGVFNFINWIFGWVFCFAWLGFFLIAEDLSLQNFYAFHPYKRQMDLFICCEVQGQIIDYFALCHLKHSYL